MARRKPIFCEKLCPVCRDVRSAKPFWCKIQRLELKLFGERGCPLGRARTSYYGVLPHQKLRQDNDL